MIYPDVLSALARAFSAGETTLAGVLGRAERTLGWPWHWLRPVAARFLLTFSGRTRPRHRQVVRFLLEDRGFQNACLRYGPRLRVAEWLAEPPRMRPVPAAQWSLPELETVGDLASWLSLYAEELVWYADLKGLCGRSGSPKLEHYRYHLMQKPSGGVRLIESPKQNLKAVQRRILSGILNRVPPHPASHGFALGRSIVSFAAPHVGRHVVLRLDLENFFPTFPAARVQAFFRTLGYPEPVADLLGGLCSNVVPPQVWAQRPSPIDPRDWQTAATLYARPHLPQGAPTSPALANLTAYRLDCRLSGLARSAGGVYTRYADDLAFSGDEQFRRGVERFSTQAAAIALGEGFSVNHRKTRVLRRAGRQELAGLVVNDRLSIRRTEIETLEAVLTNCLRHGPATQNRHDVPDFRAHLAGRVGFVEMVDPRKAARLRRIFDAINFD